MTIQDNRKDWDKFLKNIKDLKGKPHVSIGVLGSGEVDENDFGVVQYATANEFGTLNNGGNTPERSFLRSTMDEKQKKYSNFIKNSKKELLLKTNTVKSVLTKLGVIIQGDIRKKITDISDPPNAASTVTKKGSSNPLVDTGRMRASINFRVEL